MHIALVPLVVAIAVLTWNVTLAGWIATRRDQHRWFARLTALCGLLVAPAALLAVASSTDVGARTITGVAWLWPVTCLLLAVQASWATGTRLVSSSVGVPIVLYNLVIACIALADDAVARSGTAPVWLQGVVAARDAVLGMIMGRAALASPLAIMVPLIAPAYPARWRSSALVRALLVLYAASSVTLLGMEWPRGIAAVRSYDAATLLVTPREPSSFALGVRFLPTLAGPPSARQVRASASIVEQIEPNVLLLVLRARAVRASGLDSLVRVLAPYRSDSVRVIVALSFDRDDVLHLRDNAISAEALRFDALERIAERLQPFGVVPVLPPVFPTDRLTSWPDETWWKTHLTRAAARVKRSRPATQVFWFATRFDTVDSAMYAWASTPGSPISALGFAPAPSFSGLPALDARLRAADRWVAASGADDRGHWILTVGLPRAHGDAAQAGAVRHVLAWSSRRSWVRGAILGEPLDDRVMLGVLAANGRSREVLETVRQVMPR